MITMHKMYSEHSAAPTLDVVGVVDDKVSVPHHGQVHWQVTDVITLIVILENKTTTSRLTLNSVFLTSVMTTYDILQYFH